MNDPYRIEAVIYVDINDIGKINCLSEVDKETESRFPINFFRPVDQNEAHEFAREIWEAS